MLHELSMTCSRLLQLPRSIQIHEGESMISSKHAAVPLLQIMLTLAMLTPVMSSAQEPLTVRDLAIAIGNGIREESAPKLADQIRTMFGRDNLQRGANPKVDGLWVAWAIEAPGAKSVAIVSSA